MRPAISRTGGASVRTDYEGLNTARSLTIVARMRRTSGSCESSDQHVFGLPHGRVPGTAEFPNYRVAGLLAGDAGKHLREASRGCPMFGADALPNRTGGIVACTRSQTRVLRKRRASRGRDGRCVFPRSPMDANVGPQVGRRCRRPQSTGAARTRPPWQDGARDHACKEARSWRDTWRDAWG